MSGAAAGLWLVRRSKAKKQKEFSDNLPGVDMLTITGITEDQAAKIADYAQKISPNCTLYFNVPRS